MNSRRLRLMGVGLTVTACAFGLLCAERLSAEVRLFGQKPSRPTAVAPANRTPVAALADNAVSGQVSTWDTTERDSAAIARPASTNGKMAVSNGRPAEQQVKLNYLSKTWDDVLKDVAKQSGHVLVIDKVPPGRFSRNDWTPHSFTEALRILNRELEPKGFRVLERGQFLDLVFLRDARQEYSRPVLDVASASLRHDDGEKVSLGNDSSAPRLASRAKPIPNTISESPLPTQPGLSKTGNSRIVPVPAKVSVPPRPLHPNNAIELAAHANPLEDDDNGKAADGDWLEDDPSKSPSRWIEIALQHQSARTVSRSVYQAFVENAEMVEQGPGNLPGFVVWRDTPRQENTRNAARGEDAAPKRVRFTIGIDLKGNRLFVDGSKAEVAGLRKLIAKLDVAAKNKDQSVKLVTSNRDVREVAQALRPTVKRLAQEAGDRDSPLDENETILKGKIKSPAKNAAMKPKAANGGSAAFIRRGSSDLAAAETEELPVEEPNAKRARGGVGKAVPNDDAEMQTKPAGKPDVPAIIGGLKGDVNVEAMDDLGVLILRGNEQDVEAVMSIIRQIEKLSAGVTPDIHLRMLEHVDSESLAEMLTSVYERLNRTRGRAAQDATQQVTVIAVGKPNSVLILASQNDIEAVNMLIDKLDQPIDPAKEFEVFRLRYAIASQVITAIDSFFGSGTTAAGGQGQTQGQGQGSTSRSSTGLRGRVRTISDSRTNSIIVQARPRDLEEVRRLIDELDQVGNQSVNQIKLIPLKNAVADELAEILNLAIQSTISPPPPARSTQGGGQAFGGGGGAGQQGQVDQKLREAKSAVLQLLEDDGGDLVESGILADIRINPDARSNSLVVTAPEESLALIQALVRKFDVPASLVAEIKHFLMKNADAQSVATMLNQLFNNQQQTGQRGAGGNQQNQQIGVQLAGAEDASSQLIPLKFSTDIRTNSIIAVGGAEALSVVEAIILRLDASDVRQRKNTVYRLKNSPAQEVANAITLFLQGQRDLANQGNQDLISNVEQLEREIIVVAEPNSNSLLISATPRYFKEITEMVERIDAAKPEVVIQALLVEVTLDNTDEFGIELGFQDRLLFNRSLTTAADITTIQQTSTQTGQPQVTTQQIISQAATPGFLFNTPNALGNNVGSTNANPSTVAGQGLSNFAVGRTNGNLGFGGLVLSAGSESVNVLLRALAARRKLEILSRPQIRTLDSQLGTINVGQIVPVVSGITASGIAGQFVPQIIRDPSGIVLEVTPRITPDDRIVMQVHAERSNYNLSSSSSVTLVAAGAGTGAITSPVKDISTALTTVSVSNEQTIVIGGLIQKTDDQITRKVPWLGDIPVLGQAFRYDAHLYKRTELLIFLTPRIVKNDSVSEIIKQIESERMHYTECEAEALHGPLFVAPAPPSDSSTAPVYAPGGLWMPPASQGTVPPAPQDAAPANSPRIPPAPPMSDDPSSGIQGASYRVPATPRSPGKKPQPTRKPTILDTFHREKP